MGETTPPVADAVMRAADGTMRVAHLIAPGQLELRRVPVPSPGPGELLLRVEAALTCGTDLKTYRRGHPKLPLPAPLGHEAAGVVAAVGEGVGAFREGDAVALVPTAPCGRCSLCARDRENLCEGAVGRMLRGAFADYLLVPHHIVAVHVFHRPAGMDAVTAAALEPLAAVVRGADRVPLADAGTVVLVGDGPIALLFLRLAVLAGAGRVLVAGRHAGRLAVAAELGAETVAVPRDATLRDAVGERVGDGADVVVECVGLPAVWEEAAGLVTPGGTLLLYGGCAAGTRAAFDTHRIHYEEVDVRGAFHYRPRDVRRAFELLATGAVDPRPLVTHTRPLAEVDEAMRLGLEREALKVAVIP